MLSKRYESTEVDRRTWLHVPSGTHWSMRSDAKYCIIQVLIELVYIYYPLHTNLDSLGTSRM